MKASGLAVDEDLIITASAYTVDEGTRCGRELLGRGARCTAVAVANDMLAVGCYTGLDEAGLRCPDDVSLVGFNDMPFIDRLWPPLTTIRFPHYQLGTEAAQLLLERVNNWDCPVKILSWPRNSRPGLYRAARGSCKNVAGETAMAGPVTRAVPLRRSWSALPA